MRFAVLGTSDFTIRCATALLDSGAEVCDLVSMPPEARPNNSVDTAGFARSNQIPYIEVEDINSAESVSQVKETRPDYLFCTWPKILKKDVLDLPGEFCIGTHPTDLPFNRGRHPLHWLIALGICQTNLSFFRMEESIDSGNILLQVPFQISAEDDIGSAVSKMMKAGYDGTRSLSKLLHEDPRYGGTPQDHSLANTWRLRTLHDVTLDLRMSSSFILRTVRSFAPPYPCANLVFENHVMKVSGATVAKATTQNESDRLHRMEPGKILGVEGKRIRVKVDDAILDLECQEDIPSPLRQANYIHPPTKYFSDWPGVLDGYQ